MSNEPLVIDKSIGLKPNEVFVYGSNTGGIHGAGAAKAAFENAGAVWGQDGFAGNSYGISTKRAIFDENGKLVKLVTRPLKEIYEEVARFYLFAEQHPEKTFLITRIGCGLAGYIDSTMSGAFYQSAVFRLSNCFFDPEWKRFGFRIWTDILD